MAKTVRELVAAAKKAIADGDMDLAQELTEQARALDTLEKLEPSVEEPQAKASNADLEELKSLREFKKRIENEPATNKAGNLTVTQDETDKKLEHPFDSLGEQMKAVANAYLNPGAMDDRLQAQIKAKKASLGQNEGITSDGGFLVQTDFSQEIFQHAHDMSVFTSRVRRVPISSNANGLKMNAINETSRATGSRWGGVRGYWLAEGGVKTPSDIEFRQIELNLKKLAAVMYATDELLQDTTALGSVMAQAGAEELAFLVDDSILNGDGVGKPLGILSSPSLVTIAAEDGQTSTELLFENIQKIWARLYARSRQNAVWFINQDVEPALNMMDFPIGTGGVPVYLPPGGLSTAPHASLMGRPVVVTEFNETLGTVGDIVLADMSQYLMIDKGGVQSASSIHVQFLTDQTAFRWVYRVDGQPLWNSPLTPFKGPTNTLSPFVALATRS